MNKEELLKEIEKTEEHLATMKKMLEDCKYERWKPKKSEAYFYIDSDGAIEQDWMTEEFSTDETRYNFYNCFRTVKEARQEVEKILVRRQLEDIARRLNRGIKIDWLDTTQCKYYISISMPNNRLLWGQETFIKTEGVTYCLSTDFYKKAEQEIGTERLIKYLKGE